MYRPLLALGIRLACLRLVEISPIGRRSETVPSPQQSVCPWSLATRLEGHIRSWPIAKFAAVAQRPSVSAPCGHWRRL
jgi:hypothetical protein